MSQLKFDGEGGISITEHTSQFLKYSDISELIYEDVVCKLFTLTVDNRVKLWCHTLPSSSIHSFEQLFKEIHQEFDKYDYRYV